MAVTNKFIEINNRREGADRDAERVYRSALLDYNDNIRKARRAYDDALDAAEREWKRYLEELPR